MTDKRKTAHVRITYTVDSYSKNIDKIVDFIFCLKQLLREYLDFNVVLSVFKSKYNNNVEYSWSYFMLRRILYPFWKFNVRNIFHDARLYNDINMHIITHIYTSPTQKELWNKMFTQNFRTNDAGFELSFCLYKQFIFVW